MRWKVKIGAAAGLLLILTLGGCGSAATEVDPAVGDTSGMVKRTDGLLIKVLHPSAGGPMAVSGTKVTVNYVGTFANGTVFDTSVGRDPFTFTLGAGQVIAGWDEGVDGMRVGEVRRLIIPPAIGYGAKGMGPIPPNATLIFQVQLLNVQ